MSTLGTETYIVDRLRLPQYRESLTEESARALAESIATGTPAVVLVDSILLMQRSTISFLNRGSICISSFNELEEFMSKEIPTQNPDFGPVLVNDMIARRWMGQHRLAAQTLKQPIGALKRLVAIVCSTHSVR